jgi:Na+/alanine symporter
LAWIDSVFAAFSNFVWGYLVLWLLLGAGFWLLFYSRFLAYRHFSHAFELLTGRWDSDQDPGDITHFQALSAARVVPLLVLLLVLVVVFFSVSTMFAFWYYGAKCLGFLIGAEHQHHYRWFYVLLIVVGSVLSIDAVVGLITGMYGLMAIPTVISTVLLAPRVLEHARDYLSRSRAARVCWQPAP